MFVHVEFSNGSNPYIALTNRRFFELLCKYHIEQYERCMFVAIDTRKSNGAISYADKKALLRDFAIRWQHKSEHMNYSYSDLYNWGLFFAEMGRKYGLLREFRENAIC